MQETAPSARMRHRSFDFQTTMKMASPRSGRLSSGGRTSLCVSSPPEFKGEEGSWTPEHMLIGAVEGCLLMTFLTYAERKHIHILSYESKTHGTLEFIDGDYRFTRIVISPLIIAAEPTGDSDVLTVLRDAEKRCLVSNSITAVVEVNPTVRTE